MRSNPLKRGEIAVSVVWIGRFILVISALAFLSFIVARLTMIEHDTLSMDAKLQVTNTLLSLAWVNPLTGSRELGIIDDAELVKLGDVNKKKSDKNIDMPLALPQQYTVIVYDDALVYENKYVLYVNKNEYVELSARLGLQGKVRSVKNAYYLQLQEGTTRIPVVLEVTTLEKKK